MNSNPGIQNVASIAWDGTTYRAADIRKFVRFGWSFEVIAALAADQVFKVQTAPPSDADPCVPGTWEDVPEISICQGPVVAGTDAQFTIPAGTPVGTICSGTIPCRGLGFVRLQPVVAAEAADLRIILIRQGPMSPAL
jgi:hypothetical protein